MAGDIGLQRELVQQRFAEGVDRLDLQAARRFKRACKQTARLGQLGPVGPAVLDRLQPVGERFVRQGRPFGKP